MKNDRSEVAATLASWIEYGEFLITNATIYAAETIDAFIQALDEDGDYADLVSEARDNFKAVFGF